MTLSAGSSIEPGVAAGVFRLVQRAVREIDDTLPIECVRVGAREGIGRESDRASATKDRAVGDFEWMGGHRAAQLFRERRGMRAIDETDDDEELLASPAHD